MNMIDEIYTHHPYYGSRRIMIALNKQGVQIGRKKTRCLMTIMGIEPRYPKPNTSIANKEHKKYPYLLKNISIIKPNQVRSIDITYIKMGSGFVYCCAIIDWFGRKIIAWDVSPVMDVQFCTGVLHKALENGTPEIFNSNQGSQFTSIEFTGILESKGVKISMDGVGRAIDNILMERFRRYLKYEEVYHNEYTSPLEAYHAIGAYIEKYNNTRLHSSIGYKAPSVYHEQYLNTVSENIPSIYPQIKTNTVNHIVLEIS